MLRAVPVTACLVAACCLVSPPALAEEYEYHANQRTVVPPESRFEILISEIAARNTFRFDKVTGDTWQIVEDDKEALHWQKLPRMGQKNDRVVPGKVNYQAFSGGRAVRHTYLINVNSGVTWILTQSKAEDLLVWEPFE